MNLFDKVCKDFLVESVLDEPKNQLCPDIWDDSYNLEKPRLKYEVHELIAKGLSVIEQFYQPERYYIIGSILTRQWNDMSDVDVTIEFDENLTKEQQRQVVKIITSVNENMKPIKDHPIMFYGVFGEYDLDNTEAAYDFNNLEWIKQPKDGKNANSIKILKKFEKKIHEVDLLIGDLKRDLIDWNELRDLKKTQVKDLKDLLQKKYKEIVKDVHMLVDIYDNIYDERKEMYKKKLTPSEISEYHTKTRMPANLVYKMLERYHYAELFKALVEITKDGDITPKEIDSLKTEALDPSVNHRHRRAGGGLNTNRKHQNLVPDYVKARPDRNKSVDDIRNQKIQNKLIGRFEANTICNQYNCQIPHPGKSVGLGKTGIWLFNNNGVFTLKKQ